MFEDEKFARVARSLDCVWMWEKGIDWLCCWGAELNT
jgi:hypothetical protein